ncbi:Crp/Fnr family transcriptional regulator [Actinosynnema sp. NPDC020468]|uniref:Crp/Fnr family transcriptional regulator n=1 Tax=Actinosynnema sp. NPDC020468 TaxID=3154488 RepID=UPI0033D53134
MSGNPGRHRDATGTALNAADGTWPEHSLLSGLRRRDSEALLNLGTEVSYRARQVVIRQGDGHGHAVLVVSGHVKVVVTSEFGRDLLVAVRGRGDLLGEMGVLEGEPRVATVVAAGNTTARVFKAVELTEFVTRHNDAALAVARSISDRLRELQSRWVDLIVCPAHTRVARVLTDLVDQHGERTPDGWTPAIPLNQSELADLAGTALSTTEKALRQLQRAHLLRRSARRIVVTDLEGLRREGDRDARRP